AVSLLLSNSAINKLASNYIKVKPTQYLDNRREDSREESAGEAPTIYREAGTASPERMQETRWNNYISRITTAYSIRPWPEAVSLLLSNSAINKLASNYIKVKPTQYLDNRREDSREESAGEALTIYREAGTASPERTRETRWNNYISRITAAYSIRPWPEAVSLLLSKSALNRLLSNKLVSKYIEGKPLQYLKNLRRDSREGSREDSAGEALTIYREAGTVSPERMRETWWNNYISRITTAYSIRPWPEAVSLILSNSAINKLLSNYIEGKPTHGRKDVRYLTLLFRTGRLADRLIQNVMKTITEHLLERYLASKETFERSVEKNPFLEYPKSISIDNGLIWNYASFKTELEDIKNLFGIEPGKPGEKSVRPVAEILGSIGRFRMATDILTHLVTEKRMKKAYQEKSLIFKQGRQTKVQNGKMAVTDNINNNFILRRSEVNQSELKLLQNNQPFVLAGQVSYRDRDPGGTEMIILAPPVVAQGFNSGYAKSLPPITYKTEEKTSPKREQREPVMKSLNTAVEIPRKTVKQIINDVDLMNSTELNRLVDKIYSQLETRLAKERRRFGY
nr:hypothetical protein [Desulfitobacteriaceae bacterium]